MSYLLIVPLHISKSSSVASQIGAGGKMLEPDLVITTDRIKLDIKTASAASPDQSRRCFCSETWLLRVLTTINQ